MSRDIHVQMGYTRSYKGVGRPLFADPGLQADGKRRYPIDTREHARAALAHISEPESAARYSHGQFGQVRSRILREARRHGIDPYEEAGKRALVQGGE